MRKRAIVLLVILTVAFVISSCAVSFPEKESIAALSSEEATKALKGKTEKEIGDNWGEPDGMLSGFYGDIFEYDGKQIVIYYDADSRITDVLVSDKQN